VLVLDLEPDWERFLADHQWLVDAVPRFRQRVVVPTFGVGNPTWVDDPDFELSYHVRRHRLSGDGSERELLDAAAILAMTPFDRAKPPWEATLFEGLEGGRAAYVLKLHHAVSDGLGIMQLLSRVFTRDRAPVVRPRPPARNKGRGRVVTPLGLGVKSLARAQVDGRGRTAPRRRWRAASAAWSGSGVGAGGGRVPASAKRMVGAAGARPGCSVGEPLVALRHHRGAAGGAEGGVGGRRVDQRHLPLGLIGGFRRYHEEMGVALTEMPVGFPISLHRRRPSAATSSPARSTLRRSPRRTWSSAPHPALRQRNRAEPALDDPPDAGAEPPADGGGDAAYGQLHPGAGRADQQHPGHPARRLPRRPVTHWAVRAGARLGDDRPLVAQRSLLHRHQQRHRGGDRARAARRLPA
jgi:hypothetical protein